VDVLKGYKGLPHRMEYVGRIKGVFIYNDSKATNPQSTIAALRSFKKPVILIAGGRDKKMDFSELGKEIDVNVKTLILVGETSDIIALTLSKDRENKLFFAKDIKDAVKIAFKQCNEKDIILLSPACASFDMFRDYKERGEVFKREVLKIS